VIEAGLGGRYDATNVIPSKVQVLTSVGLEHTRWLGPTLTDIAGEKLAVVKDGATLVLGAGLDPEVERVAARVAAERNARIVHAGIEPGVEVGAAGTFQRRNFALARAAAQAFLGSLDEHAVAAAAAEVRVPGRLQQVATKPLTLLDGAHNPDGMRALVESLAPPLVGENVRVVAALSILDDKDAAGMLSVLLPVCDAIVFTSSQNPRALPPPTLLSLATQLGGPPSEIVPDPHRALARARELAGPDGVVIAAGSIYLIADLMSPDRRERASVL
jgi:dihydrofolate synthase / folylpolyglutamate synthase